MSKTAKRTTVHVEVVAPFRDSRTGALHVPGEKGLRYSPRRVVEINRTPGPGGGTLTLLRVVEKDTPEKDTDTTDTDGAADA